jgi:hypothetical protein
MLVQHALRMLSFHTTVQSNISPSGAQYELWVRLKMEGITPRRIFSIGDYLLCRLVE